jgi:D-3-phosphoglycerate dehydrogenase / 2-oxoglutarate reductase
VTSFRVVLTDFTDPHQDIEADVFKRSGLDITLVRAEPGTDRDLATLAPDADALLVQFAQVRKDVIDSLHNCKVISRYGIGVDMIDLEAAAARGIPVANVLDLNRHTHDLHDYVRTGGWGHRPVSVTAPRRVAGQVLGVVGLGAIGREVARKGGALGLVVLAHDPFVESPPAGVTLVDLDTLLQRSDYVTLHCPLVPQTRGLIDAAAFAKMKPTASLLNLSRGPVVDQDALLAALTDGSIAGAAVDVLTTEPPAIDDPLLSLPNLLVTPHSSSWSAESSDQLRHDAAENIVEALSGRAPRSVVNRGLMQS